MKNNSEWLIEIKNADGSSLLQKTVTHFPITIGRKAPSDIVIANTYLSTTHCRISQQKDHLIFEDLNSTNGCFLGEKQVHTHIVSGNMSFRIGTELQLILTPQFETLEIDERTPLPHYTKNQSMGIRPGTPSDFSSVFAKKQKEEAPSPIQIFETIFGLDYRIFFIKYFVFNSIILFFYFFMIEKNMTVQAVSSAYGVLFLMSLLIAPICYLLSLPAWLINGTKNYKKIYFTFHILLPPALIVKYIFIPYSLISHMGFLFVILSTLINSACGFFFMYILITTLFNSRWSLRIGKGFAILSLFLSLASITVGKNKLKERHLQQIFETSQTNIFRTIAIPQSSQEQITNDLLRFHQKNMDRRSLSSEKQ